MIEFVKYPKTVDLAGNNCGLIVRGTNLYIDNGRKASFRLRQDPGGLQQCSIYVPDLENGGSIRFDVVPSPDDSGYQLKGGIPPEDTAKQLRQNYKLSKYWNVWLMGNGDIGFETWDEGAYIISNDISVDPAVLTVLNVINGIAKTYNKGYKIFYVLLIEKNYGYNDFEPFEFFGDADHEGKLAIHLSLLKSFFQGRDLPNINQNTCTLASNSIKRYRLAIAEFYDGIMKKMYETDTYYMLPGKIASNNYPELNIPDLISSTLSYLKHGADEIQTSDTAQQYLYFLAPTNYQGQLYLKTELFFDDESPNETINVNTIQDLEQYRILIIPSGFKALGLNTHIKSKNIYKYQVSLYTSSNQIIGKIITYFVRPGHERDMVFIYENRYGMFDTFIATGETEREHKISGELHQKYLPLDYKGSDSQFEPETKDDYPVIKANTGSYTLDMAEEIEAVLSTNYFYQIINNSYRRCMLIKSPKTVSDTLKNLHSVEFEFRYALK